MAMKIPDNAVIDDGFRQIMESLGRQQVAATKQMHENVTKAVKAAMKDTDAIALKEAEITALIYATTACYKEAMDCRLNHDNAGSEAAMRIAKTIKKLIPKARQP